jgi:D-inositol-3-phosphate glycosyltransferase
MTRLAVLSLHTSPLVQPGTGDSGGMNVYVRELVGSLAQAGVACDVYVRRWDAGLPEQIEIEPGFRVVHIDAGPPGLAKEGLPEITGEYAAGVARHLELRPVDALHANYWLSGMAAHDLKHELELPLVSTFHTLARVKAETGDPEPQRRVDAEAAVIGCSDAILASSPAEAAQLRNLYDAPPDRIEIVAPGVDHAFFSPGDKAGARQATGLGPGPVLLFVGRIQPLKGLDVAVQTLARVRRQDARLVAVGGPSGRDGDAEVARVQLLARDLGVADRIDWIDPQPHHLLSTWYRAADVCLVPSRSESFGLVAIEAAAGGVPVVASAVGGLRTIVDHGRTGFLVDDRDPGHFADYVDRLLDQPDLAEALSREAATAARGYTWSTTAARLRRLYADLAAREPVSC